MPQQPLHNYLAMHRRRSGLSQDDVGHLLGIDRGTVSHHELGSKQPTFETLLGYLRLYGVAAEELFAGAYHQVDSVIRTRASELRHDLPHPTRPRDVQKLEFLAGLAARDELTYIPCLDDSGTDGEVSPSCPPPLDLPM